MMFKVLAAALVGLAASQVNNNPTTEDEVNEAMNICIASISAIARSDITCEDVIELGHCFVIAGVYDDEQPGRESGRLSSIAGFHMKQTRKEIEGMSCDTHEDTAYPEEELAAGAKIFAFDHEIVSIFDVEQRTVALEDTSALKADVEAELKQVRDGMEETIESVTASLERTVTQITNSAADLEDDLTSRISTITNDAAQKTEGLATSLDETAEKLSKDISERLAKLTETVDEELASYVSSASWANDTQNLKYSKGYEFVMMEKAPANTENGHAGRIMYKIDFNPNNRGYWHPGGQELKEGCAALSKDLQALDGIDRALKPACDVDDRCDGDSVRLQGSYLSHCGCGGHRRTSHCVGMSQYMLGGAAMYNRYHSWHGCHYLRNDNRCNHHHWADCYGRSAVNAQFTICTGSNSNYKL